MKLFWLILFSAPIQISLAQDYTLKVDYLYDYVFKSSEGLTAVNQGELSGYIDSEGKVVIPIIYNHTGHFIDGYATVSKNGVYFIIDKTGKQVSIDYERAYRAGDVDDPDKEIHVKKNGEWALLDSQMNVLIPFDSADAQDTIKDSNYSDDSVNTDGTKTPTNEELNPILFDAIYSLGEYFYCTKHDSAAFFSLTGKQLTPFKYSAYLFSDFVDGYTVAISKTGSPREVLNSKLEVVHDKNRYYEHIHGSLFITKESKGSSGVFDIETNEWKIKSDTLQLFVLDDNHLEFGTPSYHRGLMDLNGQIIIPAGRYSFSKLQNAAIVKLGMYRGFHIYESGFNSPIIYDQIHVSNDGQYVTATSDRICTVYNLDGEIIGEGFATGHHAQIYERRMPVKNDKDKWGVIQFK